MTEKIIVRYEDLSDYDKKFYTHYCSNPDCPTNKWWNRNKCKIDNSDDVELCDHCEQPLSVITKSNYEYIKEIGLYVCIDCGGTGLSPATVDHADSCVIGTSHKWEDYYNSESEAE